MVQYPTTVDRAFAALADPTRRAVLERLGSGSATVSELAEPFGMSLTGMKKHIRLLEEAQLMTTEKVGRLTVVSGETDRKEYELTGRLTVIGAEDTATVKLAGWFAPKNAALISRRGSAYFISVTEGAKKITVNEEAVQGQKQLHDGDTIIIAGVHFQFVLR